MLSVKEFLGDIKRDYASDIPTEDLLRYLNRVQRMVFTVDTGKMLFLNPNDPQHPYPYLETHAGQVEYELGVDRLVDSHQNYVPIVVNGFAVEPQSILSVFIKNVDTVIYRGYNTYNEVKTNSLGNDMVPVYIIERDNAAGPKIIFQNDPGDTHDVYKVEFNVSPVPLTSINSNMSLDLERWENELITAMVGEIEKVYDGESQKADLFYKKYRKKIQDSMRNSMGIYQHTSVPYRPFG